MYAVFHFNTELYARQGRLEKRRGKGEKGKKKKKKNLDISPRFQYCRNLEMTEAAPHAGAWASSE